MADEVLKHDNNSRVTSAGVGSDSDLDIIQFRMNPTSKKQEVESISEAIGHSAVADGTKTVAEAGTRVQLSATSVACKRVFIQSHEANGALTNGGLIVIGAVTCVAASNGRRGRALYPTQGEWFNVDNLNLLYIDSVDDGAKVHYHYEV